MINVLAGHLPGFAADFEPVLADRAVRIVNQMPGIDLNRGHCIHGGTRSRRRAAPIVLGQLFYELF
jgi:hypothetical protein